MAIISQDVLIAAQRRLRQPGFFLPQKIILDSDSRAIWVALKAHPLCGGGGVDPNRTHLLYLKDEVAQSLELIFKTCIEIINQGFAKKFVASLPEGPLLWNIISALIEHGERWKTLEVCNQTEKAHERFRNLLSIYLEGRRAYRDRGNVWIDNLSDASRGLLATIDKLLRILESKKRALREETRGDAAHEPPENIRRTTSSPVAESPSPPVAEQASTPADLGSSHAQKTYYDAGTHFDAPGAHQLSDMESNIIPALEHLSHDLETRTTVLTGEMQRHATTTADLVNQVASRLSEELQNALTSWSATHTDSIELTARLRNMRQQTNALQSRIDALETLSAADKKALEKATQNEKTASAEKLAVSAENNLVIRQLRWVYDEMLPAYNMERRGENVNVKDLGENDFDWFVGSLPEISSWAHSRSQSSHPVAKESIALIEEVKVKKEPESAGEKHEVTGLLVDVSDVCPETPDRAVQNDLEMDKILAAFSVQGDM